MKRLIHIGYYNDVEDIHAYAHLNTDEIVERVKYGLGNFYPVKAMYDWSEIVNLNYEVSTDGKILVLRDFPEDMSIIDNVNFHETKQWDYYIDVYRVLDFEDDETPSAKQAVTEQIDFNKPLMVASVEQEVVNTDKSVLQICGEIYEGLEYLEKIGCSINDMTCADLKKLLYKKIVG